MSRHQRSGPDPPLPTSASRHTRPQPTRVWRVCAVPWRDVFSLDAGTMSTLAATKADGFYYPSVSDLRPVLSPRRSLARRMILLSKATLKLKEKFIKQHSREQPRPPPPENASFNLRREGAFFLLLYPS